MKFDHRLIEPGEQVESFARDGDGDDAPVLAGAVALGEAELLEAIDQACDVGDLCDHHVTDLIAGAAGVAGASEDAEAVVEGLAESVALEETSEGGGEDAGGADDAQGGLLLGEFKGLLLAELAGQRTEDGFAGWW